MRECRSPSSRWLVAGGVLILASATTTSAQTPAVRVLDSARILIDRSAIAGDLDGLRAAQTLLERGLAIAPSDPWLLHYLGSATYREATVRMGRNRGNIRPLLERADSLLERAARGAKIPETHALRASVLGMMIGSNPLRGMTLGPRSNAQMDEALELGPRNPRVWLLRGIGAANTPSMFGGGLDKAEEYLKKSMELFAAGTPRSPAPAWGRHEAHLWLGRVHAKAGRIDQARSEYQRALEIEPGDMWIRTTLLPALDRKR